MASLNDLEKSNLQDTEEYRDLYSLATEVITNLASNNLREVKKIVDKWASLFGKSGTHMDHDDFYSMANMEIWKIAFSFDPDKNDNMKEYIKSRLQNKMIQVENMHNREKRIPYIRGKNGVLIKKDGKPIKAKLLSFDEEPQEEKHGLKEIVPSNNNIETESQFDFENDEKVNNFLESLSKIQRNILLMRMENISPKEIKDKLKISEREYVNEMNSIKFNKGLSEFVKNENDGNYKMEAEKMADRIIEISESENYRMDKLSMYSLLEDKKNKKINCGYILQREPFQWTTEEANRYFCRILSNLPIPEIIICEQKKNGKTINHLIDGLQRLSYAEAFKSNRMKIGANGAERHFIQYQDYKLDENGECINDSDGLPLYEEKVIDVVGKYYKDLPNELKKRFNNFNINVTKFFNCTDEQIADHIRDYNNHASMNKEQGGLTKISASTANYIKNISQKNTFFKNCGKFTDNNKVKGKLERVIAEAMMLLFFRDNWKSNLDAIYKHVDENATEQDFLKLNSHFNRLELALGDDNIDLKPLFTTTTMPMWVAVFDKFTTYNIDDSKFVEFLNAYNTDLKNKEIDGISMADFGNQQTKKKATITGKIDLLVKLMNEFLNIEDNDKENNEESVEVLTGEICEDTECVETALDFVKENVDKNAKQEDIDFYDDCVIDSLKYETDKLIYQQCRIALIALMNYACDKEKDDECVKWIQKQANANETYSNSQKTNTYFKHDFDKYLNSEKGAVA